MTTKGRDAIVSSAHRALRIIVIEPNGHHPK